MCVWKHDRQPVQATPAGSGVPTHSTTRRTMNEPRRIRLTSRSAILAIGLALTHSAFAGPVDNKTAAPVTPAAAEWPEFDFIGVKTTLQAPGQFAFRSYWEGVSPGAGEGFYSNLAQEIAIGLPGRVNLLLSESAEVVDGSYNHSAVNISLRYALGDYGAIPLNPMIEGTWGISPGPDNWKVTLLFSEPLGERWFWGMNGIFEKLAGGDHEREIIVTNGLRREVITDHLWLGGEFKWENAKADGESAANELLVGPSLVLRLNEHIGLVAGSFWGLNNDSPDNETSVVLQIRF